MHGVLFLFCLRDSNITLDTFRNLAPARAAARPAKGLLSSPVGEGVKRPEGRGGAGGGAGGGAWP